MELFSDNINECALSQDISWGLNSLVPEYLRTIGTLKLDFGIYPMDQSLNSLAFSSL
jgi:hypothetical protein